MANGEPTCLQRRPKELLHTVQGPSPLNASESMIYICQAPRIIKPNVDINALTLGRMLEFSAQFLDGRLEGLLIKQGAEWLVDGEQSHVCTSVLHALIRTDSGGLCSCTHRLPQIQMTAKKLMPIHIHQHLHALGKIAAPHIAHPLQLWRLGKGAR